MENQLQKINNLSMPLNTREVEIAGIVWHVNLLVAFPLSDQQLEAWAKSINEILPELDLSKLSALITDMKKGTITWDYHLGIQNLLKHLVPSPPEYTAPYHRKIEIDYSQTQTNE